MIVLLHGWGECGSDNEKQLIHGGSTFLKPEIRDKYPVIVIFPQCPADSDWSFFADPPLRFPYQKKSTRQEWLVKSLIESLLHGHSVLKKQVYPGGLSLGGYVTYDMLIRYHRLFAAAFPMCGACNTALVAKKARHVPLWIFHGAKDESVNPAFDRKVYQLLLAEAAVVKYTEYPNDGHDCWDDAFAGPDLLPWILSHHL